MNLINYVRLDTGVHHNMHRSTTLLVIARKELKYRRLFCFSHLYLFHTRLRWIRRISTVFIGNECYDPNTCSQRNESDEPVAQCALTDELTFLCSKYTICVARHSADGMCFQYLRIL